MPPGIRPAPPPTGIPFLLIPELGDIKTLAMPMPYTPGKKASYYDALKQHIGPFFDEPFEHVAVLYNGDRCDMFVGETSSINGRHIRNVRATAIYRANAIQKARVGVELYLTPGLDESPGIAGLDPESLPAISGPAVLFPTVIVWR